MSLPIPETGRRTPTQTVVNKMLNLVYSPAACTNIIAIQQLLQRLFIPPELNKLIDNVLFTAIIATNTFEA